VPEDACEARAFGRPRRVQSGGEVVGGEGEGPGGWAVAHCAAAFTMSAFAYFCRKSASTRAMSSISTERRLVRRDQAEAPRRRSTISASKVL
jgi:hypothetical protein